MGGLLSKPKTVKPPPVPEPPPVPVVSDEAGDIGAKEAERRSAFGKTIITGALTPKSTGKKRTLG